MGERIHDGDGRGAPPPPVTADDLADLDARINAILPPRYQHCYGSVGPASMGSAPLTYGPDGRVAWDQVWTTFCDLALAGGPPHRGTLLEPADPAAVAADPAGAARVADEIARAVGLVTALPADPRAAPGWVGVGCWSEAMASWLACAVVAENVSARRAGKTIYLPAGPGFRVEREIKNVVTALAKTSHYWDGHLTNLQRSEADRQRDPVFPPEGGEGRALAAGVEAGLRAASGWATDGGRYPGWVCVECPDVEAAVWLLRAVVAGGVVARREEAVLYLPTGRTAAEAETVSAAFARAARFWAAHRALPRD